MSKVGGPSGRDKDKARVGHTHSYNPAKDSMLPWASFGFMHTGWVTKQLVAKVVLTPKQRLCFSIRSIY